MCVLEDIGADISRWKLVKRSAGIGEAVVAKASQKDRWVGQALLDDSAIRCFATGHQALRADDAGSAIEPVLALKLAAIGKGTRKTCTIDAAYTLCSAVFVARAVTLATATAGAIVFTETGSRVAGLSCTALNAIAPGDAFAVSANESIGTLAVVETIITVV